MCMKTRTKVIHKNVSQGFNWSEVLKVKKLCLNDNHQNRSINEYARKILVQKCSHLTLDDLSGHTLFYEKDASL